MATFQYPSYPPELSAEQSEYILTTIKDWSIAHGLAVRPASSYISSDQDPAGALATTAPVTLFPSLFPRSCFEQGLAIQNAYNELYAAIAHDEEWLKRVVEELLEIDDFVAQLWKTHLEVKAIGYVQPLSLGLFRSDYMVHVDKTGPKEELGLRQVEFNTIASSFGGLSSKVSGLHKHLQRTGAYPPELENVVQPSSLPESRSIPSLASGLAAAHKTYGSSSNNRPLCIIFIVQDPERNVFDQRHLEYSLENHNIPTFRVAFSRALQETKLTDDRRLIYSAPYAPHKEWEVTTVYYRAGYSPDDYPSPNEWSARLLIEQSRAIKCPTLLTHLAGCKKVQQVLATPQSPHLARFIPEGSTRAALLKTFAPNYPLDTSSAGLEARKLASEPSTAQRFVMKPQREGGGNNIYRGAIPAMLQKLPESHWPAYILMEMIEPPAQNNTIFRNGEVQSGGIICELGVYGVCLWKQSAVKGEKPEIVVNEEAGYLLRTKGDQSEEGGVAAGFGAVDSVCLIDV